jgi:hypothetical protein
MLDSVRSQGAKRRLNCWMVKENPPSLKVTVLYVAVTNGGNIDAYAPRFARTYIEHPGGYPHKLVVICNGGKLTPRREAFFNGTGCEFWEHENHAGFDIGAYIDYARTVADKDAFLVCLGESVHFGCAGWLKRLADAREEYGEGMYGPFSSHMVRAHLNTSGFATDARLLAQHRPVTDNAARYEFEHGANCYWKRLQAGNHTAALVTWDGVWFAGEWRQPANIMHRGDQSNLIMGCNHSERWATADAGTKKLWSSQSDRIFRV